MFHLKKNKRFYSSTLRFWGVPIFFMVFFGACSSQPELKKLANKPPPELVEPDIKTHVFDNGLKLYFLENHELPLFQISVFFETGTVDDDEKRGALDALLINGLRSGGSTLISADDVDKKLEQNATRVDVDLKPEYSVLQFGSLAKNTDETLSILFNLIRYCCNRWLTKFVAAMKSL